MKILIAEDDPVSRMLLEESLRSWDYEVVATVDGHAAIEAFLNDREILMVILDWMMPRKAGTQVCQEIREAQGERTLYVIMLTAKAEKDDIVEALNIGADDYVTKPFDAAELRARVKAGERIVTLQSALNQKITELQEALDHVQQLQGILPLCAWCKRIRDDDNYWSDVDEYLRTHSDIKISHGICPECLAKQELEASETPLAELRPPHPRQTQE